MPGICSEVQSPKIDENMVKANDQKQKRRTRLLFQRERNRTLGFGRSRVVVQLWQWRTGWLVDRWLGEAF